ncbi:hypothetical protein EYR36_007703 [Pleurotus pulmonarius]|nr:hypothetical protein EYR36_007703 [Pleurotus pulmonarius]
MSTSEEPLLGQDYESGDKSLSSDEWRPSRLAPSRTRRYFAACISLALAALAGFLFFLWTTRHAPGLTITPEDVPPPLVMPPSNSSPILEVNPLDPLLSLKGPPTASFRDNLRPELQYITSWPSAGWTNDVMTYGNLIYLAIITDRIPVIPMFTPSHIGGSVPPIPFGEVFDVPRLRDLIGRPVLEWHEVKDTSSETVDDIGCWNLWESVQYYEHRPRGSSVPTHLKLDISYTKTPDWTKRIPNYEHDKSSTFWSLASLAFPETRAKSLVTPLESPEHHVSLPPDEQMLCFDYLYYVCANEAFEWDKDYGPAWRYVGQHMRWTMTLQGIADDYVRATIGVQDEDEPTPPFISIHVRHGDFAVYCGDRPVEECFAPISVIARRVQEVKDELKTRKGIDVRHVIMTSDERNTTWWDQVSEQGWLQVDHSKTAELYGTWYPLLIDAVIQSGGMGFVGTDTSTMSILALRRVQSWRDGATRMFKWGRPDSDDH